MIKSILACTDGSLHGDAASEYGVVLARQLKAQLAGVHVLDSRVLEGPLMADISGWVGAQPYGAQLQQFREVLEQKGRVIMEAFNERCAQAGLDKAEGLLRMGHPARVLVEEEVRTELVILGQRGIHADLLGDAMGSTAERVVRHSIKPCMVVPATFRPIEKIMIAYDGSGHASKALHEALELVGAVAAELIILTVAEDGDNDRAGTVSRDAMRLAEAHECRAVNLVDVDRSSANAIIANAAEQGADLIVMGAYGHGRIREWILGSTTAHVITHATVPVMMVR
jgi:nucleotide-binding universal stress UspA family protein